MNVFVINGSPRGEKSNTFKLTRAFLDGLSSKRKCDINIVDISKKDIEHCHGCFMCWTKTPGKCVIKDDMAELIDEYIKSDLIVWSFPLYYFGMPSKVKAFLDRTLPTNLPYMVVKEDGTCGHPSRYDLPLKRHVLISTCGFYTVENNYDAIFSQFDIMFKGRLKKIICPEGELFRVPELRGRTSEYLSYVREAGEEFGGCGEFSDDLQKKLDEPLYPRDAFIEMANNSWEISEPPSKDITNDKPKDKLYSFMRQMAASYNPREYKKDRVLEMYFTDIDKTYQLLLGNQKCTLKEDNFVPYTTRIETPLDVWVNIASGKISGPLSMSKKQYRVSGDFSTMLELEDLFGRGNNPKINHTEDKKSNMMLLLLPFLAAWIFIPINCRIGGIIGILMCSLVEILHIKWKPTVYEYFGSFLIAAISLLAVLDVISSMLMTLTYFSFGILWLVSAFLKIPITAYYSCYGYGGEERAFENPLFVRTNRILTVVWGVFNIASGIFSIFIMNTFFESFMGIISNTLSILLGIFTVWFIKWYPAKFARG